MFLIVTSIIIFFSGADEVDNQALAAEAFSQTSTIVETLVDQVHPLILVESGNSSGG